ncbi:stealth family protein [Streptomyces pratensis]|uniref:stealth family protein n=1 Tax=Streptomyces pratensis TaxID=1169025 RepID=UPI00379D1027
MRLRTGLKGLLRRLHVLTWAARFVRGRRARRRWPHLFRASESLAVLSGRGGMIALVRATASPLGLREANLELIVSLLDDAGIDYFAVRGNSDFRSVLGLSEHDRERVVAALATTRLTAPVYVSACSGDRLVGRSSLCGSVRARRTGSSARVLRTGMVWADPGNSLVLGLRYGCDIEFWRPEDGRLVAPRPNRVTEDVALDEPRVSVPVSRLTGFAALHTRRTRSVRTIEACADVLPEDVRFPVDVVYTWVDGAAPEWRRRRSQFGDAGYHTESANAARYISRDELRYSLRALEQNAPWVRHVYLVTDRQRPEWLSLRSSRLTVVDHTEIFQDPAALPTYNSHAIESQLHHIDGLSEHFLYFNDDMFLGCPTTPKDFFLSNGMTRTFFSPSQVPRWGLTGGDRPVDAAGKNNRKIILDNFGSALVQKLRHAPYALRRSVLYEMEKEFSEAHHSTSHSRFRSATDISIPSSLYHYYAYFTGRAVPSDISFAYLDLAKPEISRRLGILLNRRDRQAFCINDTVSDTFDVNRQTLMLNAFLESYFPVPSPFERKEREAR